MGADRLTCQREVRLAMQFTIGAYPADRQAIIASPAAQLSAAMWRQREALIDRCVGCGLCKLAEVGITQPSSAQVLRLLDSAKPRLPYRPTSAEFSQLPAAKA